MPAARRCRTYLTAARTAAGSAVATRLLARPGAGRVAVIGTGVQARAAALAPPPAGAVELLRAIEARAIDAGQVVEVGEVAAETARGRTSDTQLTLYKSVGVAAQDAVAAALVLAAARERGTGTRVTL